MSTEIAVATDSATVSRESEANVIKKVISTYKDFFEYCLESSTYTTSFEMGKFLKEMEKSIEVFIPNFPELKFLKESVTSIKDATSSDSNSYSYEIVLLKTMSAHIDAILSTLLE